MYRRRRGLHAAQILIRMATLLAQHLTRIPGPDFLRCFIYLPEQVPFVCIHALYCILPIFRDSALVIQVMDDHLAGKKWLAAGQFTIADIATFSWVFTAPWAGGHHPPPSSIIFIPVTVSFPHP